MNAAMRPFLFFLFVSICTLQAIAQNDQPNILLIIADDLGIDVLNGYGISGSKPVTPHLDALRETGINFTNCWASPQCTPTRAVIMSGKFGIKTGVMDPPGPLNIEHTSIFNRVKANPNIDYNMAVIGKWHLAGAGNNLDQPAEHGVDHYEGLYSSGVDDYYEWEKVTNGETETISEYTTTHLTDAAIDWIDQQDEPWFLWLAHAAPHSPLHTPPEGLYSTSPENNRTTYYAMIEAMDHEIGRLLDNMESSVRENTVIIFIGDNGTPSNTSPFFPRGHGKSSIYEGGVRVPFFVSGKGITRTGSNDETLVQATDLHATILNLMGMDFDGGLNNSLNLAPLFAEEGSVSRAINYTDYDDDDRLVWATRTDRYKLIEDENGDQEFYDVIDDLLEENNLIDNLTDDQRTIKELLETEAQIIRSSWSCNDGILNGEENSIDDCNEVLSINPETEFSIWPNPSDGTFQISVPTDDVVELSVYSVGGKRLIKHSFQRDFIVKGLPTGIFLLNVISERGSSTRQVIVR